MSLVRRVVLPILAMALALPVAAQTTGQPAAAQPARMGEPFQPAAFPNLNAQAGGEARIDLAEVIGRKPVVLLYWIAGHPRADLALERLQALADELGADKLAVYGVAVQRPGREADVIRKRLAELGVRLPVLDDAGFRIGQQLQVQSVPSLTILDAEGRLRLSNGGALHQVLGYEETVETAIRRVAEARSIRTYGFLERYYPVKELVGKPCPDFKAPLLSNSVEQRWSSLLKSDKLNVLIFWSVDCPHCRTSLPEINDWLRNNAASFNVVTAASVVDDASKFKTKQFCEINGFVFPTLVDRDNKIGDLYQVTSTPTILIIRPDGVVDSVLLSGQQDIGKKLEEKKRELL